MPFAVFFDMLGSTRMFAELPDEIDFDKVPDPISGSFDDNAPPWAKDYFSYWKARSNFHRSISIATDVVTEFFLFRASFSDCAYLVYSTPLGISLAAAVAMRMFYRSCVPVRGGIGYGNFGKDRVIQIFRKNHVSTESFFFGSALARAHVAESCGLKGLRVFIHESAAPQLKSLNSDVSVFPRRGWDEFDEGECPKTLPGTVISLHDEATTEVKNELCFIGDDDVSIYLRALEMIKSAFPPRREDAIHYEKTIHMLNYIMSLRDTK